VQLVPSDRWALKVSPVLLVQTVSSETRVLEVTRVHQDHLDSLARLVDLVLPVLPATLVNKVLLDKMALLVPTVSEENLVHLVSKV
jgi:hypothetical protein